MAYQGRVIVYLSVFGFGAPFASVSSLGPVSELAPLLQKVSKARVFWQVQYMPLTRRAF